MGMSVMINTRKTTQDILQEEMLRERAAVLARAGEQARRRAGEAREDRSGDFRGAVYSGIADGDEANGAAPAKAEEAHRILCEINAKIRAYNRQREQVKTRYYYLIVTREALGLIHHQRLAEIYRIPPKKHVSAGAVTGLPESSAVFGGDKGQ